SQAACAYEHLWQFVPLPTLFSLLARLHRNWTIGCCGCLDSSAICSGNRLGFFPCSTGVSILSTIASSLPMRSSGAFARQRASELVEVNPLLLRRTRHPPSTRLVPRRVDCLASEVRASTSSRPN